MQGIVWQCRSCCSIRGAKLLKEHGAVLWQRAGQLLELRLYHGKRLLA